MGTNFSSNSIRKAIDLVSEQIQRATTQKLRSIEVSDDISLPPELGRLIANINLLIEQTGRERIDHDALMQSEKMITLGELVAGTSHELNNPLAIVTGYSDLLLEDRDLTGDQRTKIESIRKNAMRASSVVHSLLAFARKRKPERLQTDLNTVVAEACQLKEYDLRTSGIAFEKRFAPDLQLVYADPHQIQQVVLNILNNAQDAVLSHSGNKPWIAVSTEGLNDRVLIKIRDSGPGIPKVDLRKVFDPFFTTKPVGKGTGLGLSISYGIIREHGGSITIDSNPVDGTMVVIAVPTGDFVSTLALDQNESPDVEGTLKVLVVDDEPEIVTILKTGFTRAGISVDSAGTMDDALKLVSTREYDVILTDIKMPGGNGFDLFYRLCAMNPKYRSRTVLLTGDASNPETAEFLEKEGVPYFEKPFDFTAIEKMFREKRRKD
jgi:two-component system NtrC family sensor kinase